MKSEMNWSNMLNPKCNEITLAVGRRIFSDMSSPQECITLEGAQEMSDEWKNVPDKWGWAIHVHNLFIFAVFRNNFQKFIESLAVFVKYTIIFLWYYFPSLQWAITPLSRWFLPRATEMDLIAPTWFPWTINAYALAHTPHSPLLSILNQMHLQN